MASSIPRDMAWSGRQIARNCCWQYQLGAAEVEELNDALLEFNRQCKDSEKPLLEINSTRFKLPRLASKLKNIAEELESGCGFVRLRGLPIDLWDSVDLQRVWMGIASHLGKPVYQNPHGQIIRQIEAEQGDVGQKYGQLNDGESTFLSSRARTASNAQLRFHTDRCDIVGLLCIGQAKAGGLSRIASSVAVHNEMRKRAPDYCACLYENLPRSRIGEEADGEKTWYELPVWSVYDGRFTSHYSRTYVEALQHVENAPKVSDTQWQALDMLSEIADEIALQMVLRPGDIQFLNNHVIYHARSEFTDAPEENKIRRLLRIWLSAPNRALPPEHKVLWGEVAQGKLRGGIAQTMC